MKKKLYIKTYGCQMNIYDSVKMSDLLAPYGYISIEEPNDADVIILNTCNIREKAAEKTYSELGRVRIIKEKRSKIGKKTVVAVAGCVSQAEGDVMFKRAPIIDIVVGPQSYQNLPDMISEIIRGSKHLMELEFKPNGKFDALPEAANSQGVCAYLSIQEGCNQFCTFCSVPYTRGAEYSRPLSDVYREALNYVKNGAKEITLLGQNVNAYHGDSENGTMSLAKLITHISSLKGLERIRYTTSHPNDMTKDLIELHGSEPKLMPFLHLPVQSGSDNILKNMNRKHTIANYIKIIDDLKVQKPDIAFSSDFIVGFPGEKDEDFQKTLDIVEKIGFASAYSFKYSPRPGTPAANKEQIDENVKDKRLQKLQIMLNEKQRMFNESFIGKNLQVLFEKKGKHIGQIMGRSPYMQAVNVIGNQKYINQIVNVEIVENLSHSLFGIIKE